MQIVTKTFDPKQWAERWLQLGGRIDTQGRIGEPWRIWISADQQIEDERDLRDMLLRLTPARRSELKQWVQGEVSARRWGGTR